MTTANRQQRIYLHVGLPKTGTTYLQDRLWRNRDVAMRRSGLLYPGHEIDDHFHAAAHLQPGRYLDWVDPAHADAWPAMVRQMRSWSGPSIVSHELFATATPEQAAQLLRDLDFAPVHIVVTVRDLARQIPSVWQENVKNQYRATFDDFVTAIREDDPSAPPFWEFQDYPRILRTWAADLPPERVHVVAVPPPGSHDSLWARFISVLGVDDAELDRVVDSSNAALTPVQVELLRQLNSRLQPEDIEWSRYEAAVKRFLIGSILFETERAAGQQLLPADRIWAAERSEQMLGDIAAAGYRVTGSPDDLRVAAATDAAPADPIGESAVLSEALDAMAAMLKVMALPEERLTAAQRAKAIARGPARRVLSVTQRLRR
ncbi:hypothetical protein [Jongsikchunia kroppenstedtii]|uniref:hypothetical protein n=1 Tax=Jongsikchunia kroppenstedtii TaxID=1121721 RepID=UPI0003799444|nr:hypothetical protein [Jongsikchunia kroppenstedtii]